MCVLFQALIEFVSHQSNDLLALKIKQNIDEYLISW